MTYGGPTVKTTKTVKRTRTTRKPDPTVRGETAEAQERTKSGKDSGVSLVPQPHGGALWSGGVPGNRGGSGGLPSALRERLRGSLADRVQVLEEIADRPRRLIIECAKCGHATKVGPPASDADRIRAVDVLAKYGLGTLREVSIDHVRDRLRRTLRTISDTLEPGDAERVIGQLREVWRE